MDLGFDPNDMHRDAASKPWAGDCGLVPDWHDLLPRLFAGWSARRELLNAARPESPRRGNFDAASAQALAGFEHASHAVNQAALGNRKPDGGIGLSLAGDFHSGTRG